MFLDDGTLLRGDTDLNFNKTVIVFFIGSTASFGNTFVGTVLRFAHGSPPRCVNVQKKYNTF